MVRSSWRMSYLLLDEVVGQGVEQLGVGRRIGQREVVHRVDDADAEVVAPDAIGEAAGEERVVRRAHPVEQRLTRVLAVLRPRSRGRRAPWAAAACSVSGSSSGRLPPLPPARPTKTSRSGASWFFLALLLLALGVLRGRTPSWPPARRRRSPWRRRWRRRGSRPGSSGRRGACGTGRTRGGRRGRRRRSSRPTGRGVTCLLPPPEQIERRLGRRRRSSNPCRSASSRSLYLLDVVLRRHAVAAGGAENAVDDLVVGHVLGEALAEPVVPHLAELRRGAAAGSPAGRCCCR